ncbi:hypothetical protein N8261_03580 [Flavobacteriaceae bacterium]|nr:hypothetical protein [Flavobacteriaceae bacterium]
MIPISPYDLETGHTYYIESYTRGRYNYNKGCYDKGVRTNKYRGVINNLNVGICDGHNVVEIGNTIEYVNGQETTSTERYSPTFPGNVFCIYVTTNTIDGPYWLFYKPVADYLMTTQVLRQRSRLDKVSIWGLYKQHLGKDRVESATSDGIPPLTCRRTMQMVNLNGAIQVKYAYLTPEEKKLKSEEWRFRCAKV